MENHISTVITENYPELSQRKKITRNPYEDVTLTEEEQGEALRKGREKKFYQMREEAYWAVVNTEVKIPTPTAEEYFDYICERAKEKINGFYLDEQREKVYRLLSEYFTKDPKFTDKGYSLKKGILIMGNTGCGKSKIMSLFSNNPLCSYYVRYCNHIAADYQENGDQIVIAYKTLPMIKSGDQFKHQYCGYYFDDLGTEPTAVRYYGSEPCNVMERVLFTIYSSGNPFFNYHISTNLTSEELEKTYGSRITSRFREMFNQIIMEGGDLRK